MLRVAGDVWEQLVETYLTLDRGLLLNPQYLIGDPGVWEANPDFLAVSFPDNTAWMVEVTKSPASKLFAKIDTFESDYVRRIREQLVRHKIIRDEDATLSWKVGFWAFAPAKDLAKIEERARTAGVKSFSATSLEDTILPAWEKRFR